MAKLKPGAVTIDLVDGNIHGDLDHCPREDLLESAEALLSILPQLDDTRGVWGLSKDFDTGCHVYTRRKNLRIPEGIALEADIYWGPGGMPGTERPVTIRDMATDRDWVDIYMYVFIRVMDAKGTEVPQDL